ncbi:MAG: flagellar hook-basal body complex protein [Alphaproteobacteria bacterium]|nr:flagellar hook-basal body complex protein [Alphaproteobacteria bacterium]
MSLFGSLITGVSALSAQAQSMGMIANNIANVSTVGYKRREAAFQSLVTSESGNARYTPGSVLSRTIQKINSQGALQQTNAPTDVAISGNGFFVVQRSVDGLQESFFTRAGSFTEDENGFLQNTAGFFLMGWRLDDNGDLPAGRDDISSLEPINVSLLGGLTKATTSAEFNINLDAAEPRTDFPVSTGTQADFSRTVRVFDSLGAGQDLELQFTHHISPTAYSKSAYTATQLERDTVLSSLNNVSNTETMVVNVGTITGTTPFVVTSTNTVQDFINYINNDTNLRDVCTAELDDNDQIRIYARNFDDIVTVTGGATVVGTQNAASALGFDTMGAYNHSTGVNGTGLTPTTVLDSITNIDNTESIDITVGTSTYTFAATLTNTVQDLIDGVNTNMAGVARAELTAAGAIKITALDRNNTVAIANNVVVGTGMATALGFTAVAETAPTPPTILPDPGLSNTPTTSGWWQLKMVDSETGTVIKSGSMNFGANGSLNGLEDLDGLKSVALNDVNWGNGSELQDIVVDIGGLTQFSGEYNVTSATQNGAELGLRTGVEIDRDGIVSARFSNGQTSALFKLPIATFTSPNNLSEQIGNSYNQTSDSGSYNLREAGSGGAGLIEASAVESSNVDIADEFTKMIVTQRAYSAGTKVIRTADEMTEELLRLR